MRNTKRYASYEDFEREEYLCVKSFYQNLEDIAEDDLFARFDEPNKETDSRFKERRPQELEF